MRKFFTLLLMISVAFQMNAQELNCTISVNSDKIPGSN